MPDRQLDLFAGSPVPATHHVTPPGGPPPLAPTELNDAALVAAIPASGVTDGRALAVEAGRRRLGIAVPVLEDYCRRFAGFGTQRALPEQIAALDALAAIGGSDAARAVERIIGRGWVQGPTLANAVAAAVRLGSQLPAGIVVPLLRHADPAIRADACRLARSGPDVAATLIDLLGDLHPQIATGAACALGRMGRAEALKPLKQVLLQEPTAPVIEAVAPIADEECIVMLGRIAKAAPDLGGVVADALEAIEHPRAVRVLQRLRQG
jgi:hypothetical protein